MDKIILICPEDIYMAWLSRFVLLDVEYEGHDPIYTGNSRDKSAIFISSLKHTLPKIIKCNTCVRKASRYIIDE